MRLFGFDITRRQVVTPTMPYDRGYWWWPIIREPFTGAWQRNMELRADTLATHHAIYACITLIASDIAKCRVRLMEEVEPDIWEEASEVNSPFWPVLRKPNSFQNRIQFFENWVISKLVSGNTYVLKTRDQRGIVVELVVLDPTRTKPLVAPDSSVFYEISSDNLAGVEQPLVVPASEIIHDMATLRFHPLCGIPPMAPASLAATQGLKIQQSSVKFFENDARPGGILTAPGPINEVTAKRLKDQWEQNYSGANRGRIAVVGDGLTFKEMAQTAVDSQLIEQLGISSKMVCSAFNVPPYKVQVGDPPSYNNVSALNTQYYTDCLQKHFEAIELALDEGLGLTAVKNKTYGTEFDIEALLRMDSASIMKSLSDGVRGGFLAPNEARKRLSYRPVAGGDSPMMQHQDYSLAALAKRDAKEDPFASSSTPPPASSRPPEDDEEQEGDEDEEADRALLQLELKSRLNLADVIWRIERDIDRWNDHNSTGLKS